MCLFLENMYKVYGGRVMTDHMNPPWDNKVDLDWYCQAQD